MNEKKLIFPLYLWLHMADSFFLPSIISSNKSSICPTTFSFLHCTISKQLFNLPTFSLISSSKSIFPILSKSIFNSFIKVTVSLNSWRRIPERWIFLNSDSILRCNLAAETINTEPNISSPSYPLYHELGRQYTNPPSNIIKCNELTFRMA